MTWYISNVPHIATPSMIKAVEEPRDRTEKAFINAMNILIISGTYNLLPQTCAVGDPKQHIFDFAVVLI